MPNNRVTKISTIRCTIYLQQRRHLLLAVSTFYGNNSSFPDEHRSDSSITVLVILHFSNYELVLVYVLSPSGTKNICIAVRVYLELLVCFLSSDFQIRWLRRRYRLIFHIIRLRREIRQSPVTSEELCSRVEELTLTMSCKYDCEVRSFKL